MVELVSTILMKNGLPDASYTNLIAITNMLGTNPTTTMKIRFVKIKMLATTETPQNEVTMDRAKTTFLSVLANTV